MAIEKENVLTKNSFDPIIASLEILRSEIQGYRNDLDGIVENLPELVNLAGSTPQMLEIEQVLGQLLTIESEIDKLLDIYTNLPALGDIHTSLPALNAINSSLAGLNSIAGALPELNNIEGNLPALVAIEGSLPMLNALEQALPEITAVHSNLPSINSVAGIESEIQAIAGNIQAILDAPTHAQTAVDAKEDSEQARDDAQTWAEGDDPAVELLGGNHSAKTWAEISEQHTREGIRFLGTVDDLENLPPNPGDGDAYFYAETVGDNAIGYGVVWSESEDEWIVFQMGATLIPGTMLPDQEASPAAENQTTFGGFSANPAMSLVMINRIEQESDTYTFDGNQIVFSEGLSSGDIVRVRQWRTQVNFENLPDVETLSPEDKIPVQTSQGAGVIDLFNLDAQLYIARNPRLIVYDNFAREDSPTLGQAVTGQSYIYKGGGHRVENMETITNIPGGGSGDVPLSIIETGLISYSMDFVWSIASIHSSGINAVLSYVDADNYFLVRFRISGVTFYEKVGGIVNQIESTTFSPSDRWYGVTEKSISVFGTSLQSKSFEYDLEGDQLTRFNAGRGNVGFGNSSNSFNLQEFKVWDI